MNMFNKLPYFVFLQERKYKINVDFRKMISFENKVQDKSIGNEEKIKYLIQNFYPNFYLEKNYNLLKMNKFLYKEACNKLIWFYKCGRENYHKKSARNGNERGQQIYSYEYDDEYIWGAFYEYYNIDLTVDKVHWWKFKAMFNSLPEKCEFKKIMQYRAYSGDDKNMKELKKYWELPLQKEEQKRLDALYETLK